MDIKAKVVAALSLNMLLWLLMFIALAGLLSCAAGEYLALRPALGATAAAFITGGTLLGLVALIVLAAIVVQSAEKRQGQPSNSSGIEQQLRPFIGGRASHWVKNNSTLTLVGALAAGILLTANPRIRSTLTAAAGPILTRKAIKMAQDFVDPD